MLHGYRVEFRNAIYARLSSLNLYNSSQYLSLMPAPYCWSPEVYSHFRFYSGNSPPWLPVSQYIVRSVQNSKTWPRQLLCIHLRVLYATRSPTSLVALLSARPPEALRCFQCTCSATDQSRSIMSVPVVGTAL